MSTEKEDELWAQLWNKHLPNMPKAVADRVFTYAWQEGHSAGLGEVEMYYGDYAELVTLAYEAGHRDGFNEGWDDGYSEGDSDGWGNGYALGFERGQEESA